jgi:hypothetical protein
MPASARAEKFAAIELEVVPFDAEVVALTPEVVPLGRAAVANALAILVLAFVPCRTLERPIHCIPRMHHRRFRATRTCPRMSRFDRMPVRKSRGRPPFVSRGDAVRERAVYVGEVPSPCG